MAEIGRGKHSTRQANLHKSLAKMGNAMKEALTPCEQAFKEWLQESGGSPTPQQQASLWTAFRAGWYARQGARVGGRTDG